jgi:hypothetical protein
MTQVDHEGGEDDEGDGSMLGNQVDRDELGTAGENEQGEPSCGERVNPVGNRQRTENDPERDGTHN